MNYLRIRQYSQVKTSSMAHGNVLNLFKRFNLQGLVKAAGIVKEKGHSPMDMLFLMLLMILESSRSIYSGISSLHMVKLKNPLNNMLNDEHYNWRKLLYSVAKRYTKLCPTRKGDTPVLIIDDTAKAKRGRKGENSAWFVDHCRKVYYMGFQAVVSIWSNGTTAVPIDVEVKIGKARIEHAAKTHYHKGTHTRQRELMAKQKKLTIAVSFIKRALQRRFSFRYVLWDSWYTCTGSLRYVFSSLKVRGIDLISMVKRDKQLYRYRDKCLTIKDIYGRAGAWKIQSDTGIKYKSVLVGILDKSPGLAPEQQKQLGEVRMCFYKYPSVKRFKVIISTDVELNELEVLSLYLRRWAVEVVFRDLKQHFGFDQSKSSKYAPQIADLTIRCVFYTMFCSLRYDHPEKSTEQLLIEFRRDMEELWLDTLCKIVFQNKIRSFLRYTLAKGYVMISELMKDLDYVVKKFFDEAWDDDIFEEMINYDFSKYPYPKVG